MFVRDKLSIFDINCWSWINYYLLKRSGNRNLTTNVHVCVLINSPVGQENFEKRVCFTLHLIYIPGELDKYKHTIIAIVVVTPICKWLKLACKVYIVPSSYVPRSIKH